MTTDKSSERPSGTERAPDLPAGDAESHLAPLESLADQEAAMGSTVDEASRPTKLMNRTFLLIWLGQSVSSLGVQIFTISMVFWIKDATGSATLLGLLEMLSALPAVILGPIAGAIADRHSRRKIIIIADIASAIAVLCLVAVILTTGGAVRPTLIALFTVSVLVNLIATFFQPAVFSLLPDIVPADDISKANTLAQVAYQLVTFAGLGLGGTLYRVFGATAIFVTNVVTYTIAGGAVSLSTEPPRAIPASVLSWSDQFRQVWADIVEGFRYAWGKVGLRHMVLLSGVTTFFAVPVILLLPFYVEDVLLAEADWYGFISAAYGVGNLAGFVLSGAVKPSGKARGRLLLAFLVIQSLGYGLLGLIRTPVVAMGIVGLGGVLSGYITISITMLVQVTTEPTIRGRVFGLLGSLSGSLAPISMGLTGVITDLLDQNIPLLYVSSGLIMTAICVAFLFGARFRDFVTAEYDLPSEPVPGDSLEPQAAG